MSVTLHVNYIGIKIQKKKNNKIEGLSSPKGCYSQNCGS